MKKRSFFAAFWLIATHCLHAQVFVGPQYSSLSSDNWKYVREDVETLENAIFTSVDEDDARSALMFSAGLNMKVHFGK